MACVSFRFKDGSGAGIVTVGGPVRKIYAAGRMWHFEMHHFCGPTPVRKRTYAEVKAPMAFWEAVTLWAQQGERVDATGVALYDPPPPPPPLYKIGRGQYTEDLKMAAKFGVTEPIDRGSLRKKSNRKQSGDLP